MGGDVITVIEGEPVPGFDDLLTYLARNVEVGDTVTLTILRDGEQLEQTAELGESGAGEQRLALLHP